MITKAQLDAALSDLEKRIGKSTDFKIETRIALLREELSSRMEEMDGRREAVEDETFAQMEQSISAAENLCRTNAEEIKALREKLSEIERFVEEAAEEERGLMEDNFEEEIRDDFGR